jgi:hypothetical protein
MISKAGVRNDILQEHDLPAIGEDDDVDILSSRRVQRLYYF